MELYFTDEGTTLDPIMLNKNNAMTLSVNFGSANPVNLTKLKFDTSSGWSYDQTTNLTNTSSALSLNSAAQTQSYQATVGNSVATTDLLKLQGKFYGANAESTGGVMSGTLTGTKSALDTQRTVQGIFKGAR